VHGTTEHRSRFYHKTVAAAIGWVKFVNGEP